jgi:signal transduction histidine kinase
MRPRSYRSFSGFLIGAVATLVGIGAAGQLSFITRGEAHPFGFVPALGMELPVWWYWALATPLIVMLGRRAPVDGARRGKAIVVHLGAAFALTGVHAILFALLNAQLAPVGSPQPPLGHLVLAVLLNRFLFDLLVYAAILGIASAVDYHNRFQARAVDAARLESALAQAELQALKMQLHPHFLFNTLNTIGVLTEENPAAAKDMLTLLADLLRATLEQSGTQEIRLAQELELLESYLEIERTRFSDRLTVTFEVEPETLEAWVPNLVLQPLVENAVRYAIAPRSAPGRIAIRARRESGELRLSVEDDGPGVPSESSRGTTGMGLSTTRARLERLYGGGGRLRLEPAPGGGTVASVTVPFRIGGDLLG